MHRSIEREQHERAARYRENLWARRVTQRIMSELGQQEISLGSCEHLLTWTAAAQAARHAEGSATPPITQTYVDRFKHFPLD